MKTCVGKLILLGAIIQACLNWSFTVGGTVVENTQCVDGKSVTTITVTDDCSSSCTNPPPTTTYPPPPTTTAPPPPPPPTTTAPPPPPTTTAPPPPPTTTTPPPPPLNFTLVIDDNITAVYADGVLMDRSHVEFRYVEVGYFVLPATTSQVSIQGLNRPKACAFIGSDTTGKFLTGSNWRCTNTNYPGWSNPGYDDSAWEAPTTHAQNYYTISGWLPKTLGPLPLNKAALVLWTKSCLENQPIFCRSPRQ